MRFALEAGCAGALRLSADRRTVRSERARGSGRCAVSKERAGLCLVSWRDGLDRMGARAVGLCSRVVDDGCWNKQVTVIRDTHQTNKG
jgi:hypothetical protein